MSTHNTETLKVCIIKAEELELEDWYLAIIKPIKLMTVGWNANNVVIQMTLRGGLYQCKTNIQ